MGPDGRIVFPRNGNLAIYKGKQVYIGDDLTLVVKNGNVGYVNASRLAREGQSLPAMPLVEPEPVPSINEKEKYYLVYSPDKKVYKKGEAFDIEGFIAHAEGTDGVRSVLDNSKIYFMVSGTVKVTSLLQREIK